MPKVSYAFAFLVGTFLECVLYGVFIPLFVTACCVQWNKFSKKQEVNRVMVFSTVFFGFTITFNCVLTLFRSIRATLYTPPGVTICQYLDPPYPTEEIIRWAVFQVQIVVADIIMVYRMYHIYYGNLFVCAIPSATITALFAVGCGLTNQLRDLTTLANQRALDKWSSACFCLTIFNSLFTTVAISFRLWSVHRETAGANIRVRDSVILRAMKVLIESAALWTAFVAMDFSAFLAKSSLLYMFLAMTSPAVGISFCLIIVRMGRALPEARDETWHVSIHTPAERNAVSDQVTVSFVRSKTQQEVYSSDSKESPLETLKSQRRGRVNSLDDSSEIIRPPLNLPVVV